MATISLCMIVKNEEAVLQRCLDSVADLMDEIIIVDTGSTDRTKEIASRYTDKLYDFEWTDDFSAARNYSFSKAGMDYIYVADADEVIDRDNHRRFLLLKQALAPEIEIVQMKYITPGKFNTVMNIRDEYRPKLYKRLRQFRWIDPVHETVRTQPLVFDSDIEILHMPQSLHSGRDFSVFLRAFESGQPLSAKLHTMYARELHISGSDEDFLKAQPVFTRTLAEETEENSRVQEALCILCRCMHIRGELSDFFKYATRAIAHVPCSEICCELGGYFFQNQDYGEAIRWYLCAAYESSAALNIHTSGDLPLARLAECYRSLAGTKPDKREEYVRLAEEYEKSAKNWQMPRENDHS